uniref:Cysteine-rich RLK (Receptor-like protein kinase) 26 n=1 Tax=Tanacetum cinerariifolium TaxID=118510 RepID=A0A6L2NVA2_TANCI|nr:cysteine-rich RLK (receptor-like protein kinase) 26 [Tanacetum cinerariifolium]
MIDPTLKTQSTASLPNIIRSIHIGLLCVQENVNDRPTMGSDVNMLNNLSIELPQPSRPSEFSSSSGSSEIDRIFSLSLEIHFVTRIMLGILAKRSHFCCCSNTNLCSTYNVERMLYVPQGLSLTDFNLVFEGMIEFSSGFEFEIQAKFKKGPS